MLPLPRMRYISCLLILLLLSSCDPDEACISSATNELLIGFVERNNNGDLEASSVEYEAVLAEGAEFPYYVDTDSTDISLLLTSLDPEGTETTFIFADGEDSDTLIIGYRPQLSLISPECGLETKFQSLEVVSHTFTFLELKVTELNTLKEEADLEIIR